MASTAISTGRVTEVAIPTWSRAAITPSATITTAITRARMRPYARPPSALAIRSCTAFAMAAATTMITMATNARGSQAISWVSRSLTGFGPQTPNASCSANSSTA